MSDVTPLRLSGPDEAPAMALLINYEAERALLGAILIENSAYEKVGDFLKPEHFADPVHGRIFEVCGKMIERGQVADPRTVRMYFEHKEALPEIGGAVYIARLAEEAMSPAAAQSYGNVVHDLALRRQLMTLGRDIEREACEADVDVSAVDLVENLEGELSRLAVARARGGFHPLTAGLARALEHEEAAYRGEIKLGISTGISDLDKRIGGLFASDLIIIAGRTSMGKTALALNISYNVARAAEGRDQGGVGYFSLEMTEEQLAMRLQARIARVDGDNIRRGTLSADEIERLVSATEWLEHAPLYIDETSDLTVNQIRSRAKALKRKQGIDLVVVDYLQLVDSPNRYRDNRVQQVSEITRQLKCIAKELDVPVIALSQLSRAVENRDDKRPKLSDLRESGSIEQDADVVILIFREEYYLAREEPLQGGRSADEYASELADWQPKMDRVRNMADIIVPKMRMGSIGCVRLFFDAKYQEFTNLEQQREMI